MRHIPRLANLLLGAIALAGCRDGVGALASPCDGGSCPTAPPLDRLIPLAVTTYDGSGQVVHPDVIAAPDGRGGFLMAITPYPFGNSAFENPSLLESDDGTTWTLPPGLVNPVARPGPAAYLSDPDLVFDETTHQLWLYYRQVAGGTNQVLLTRSGDGAHWTAPVTVATAPSHDIVSPSVVHDASTGAWTMWSVNSGAAGCDASTTTVERRSSADGIHWSDPAQVQLAQPGAVIWHIEVQWIPSRQEYWAVYNSYPAGRNCVTDALYLATSPDGVQWTTYPSPIARRSVADAFADIIYRSSFQIDATAGTVRFWFSGAKYAKVTGYTWGAATETRRVADLFATINRPAPIAATAPAGWLPPPEPDAGPEAAR